MTYRIKFLAWTGKQSVELESLVGANLVGASLYLANLTDANMAGANLTGADMTGADMTGADMTGANMTGANMTGADLAGANMTGANLYRANMTGANLAGANLTGAKGAEDALARTVIVPEGTLVVWKKLLGGVIAKLRIPEAARRSNAAGRKCRAEFAEVLELSMGTEGHSQHDCRVVYRVGETVHCHEWCDDRWQECAGGIHFYLTREEAEADAN